MRTACVLYPGEMGGAVARLLLEHGWGVVSFLEGRSQRTRDGAEAAGISAAPTLEAAVARADLVISLVPQSSALDTAAAFARAAYGTDRRPPYLDANSISPDTMTAVADVVASSGAACVDGAFVGSAARLGGTTTLYVSGPEAQTVGSMIAEAFLVRVLGSHIGLASAFKLSFSGFNKGLVALFLETVSAADRLGQREQLMNCLQDFYPGTVETVERLLPSYPRHVGRRIEELEQSLQWLRGIEEEGPMASATRSVFEKLRDLDLPGDHPWESDALVEEYCRRRSQRRPGSRPGGRESMT